MVNSYTGVYIVLFLTNHNQGIFINNLIYLQDSVPTIEWFSKQIELYIDILKTYKCNPFPERIY